MKNQDLNPLDIRLSPHQSRLIIDSRSLAVKLERLQKFIAGSPEFQELSSDDKFDMRRQRDVMDAYLKILNLRIDRISIPTPGEQVQATGVNLLFENAPKAMTEDPVMSPLLKERLENCNCIGCQINRAPPKQEQEQAKATPETPPDDADTRDCNQRQPERATRRSERISKNLGEPLFKKARQMNMISFDMSGPPLSDNMKKVLSDMLMKQAIKRVMGVDQGQAPKAEPVGMDAKADSFEAINQEPPALTEDQQRRQVAVSQCNSWSDSLSWLIECIEADSDGSYTGIFPRPKEILSSMERHIAKALLKEALVRLGKDRDGWQVNKVIPEVNLPR